MSALPIKRNTVTDSGSLVQGKDKDDTLVRYDNPEIAQVDGQNGNWEPIIESLYDVTDISGGLSVDTDSCLSHLVSTQNDIECNEQAALILSYLEAENRLSINDGEVVFFPQDQDAGTENPALLYNLSVILRELGQKCKDHVETYRSKLTSVQETVEELKQDEKVEEEIDKCKQDIKDDCNGEIVQPERFHDDSEHAGQAVGVEPPDSVKNALSDHQLEIYKRRWSQIIDKRGGLDRFMLKTHGEEYMKLLETRIDELENAGQELQRNAGNVRARAVMGNPIGENTLTELLDDVDNLQEYMSMAEGSGLLEDSEVNADEIANEVATATEMPEPEGTDITGIPDGDADGRTDVNLQSDPSRHDLS